MRERLAAFQPLLALIIMVAVLSVASETFRTSENGANVLRQISVNLCLSTGMTLVVLSGGIDLSVGSVLALSGAITAGLIRRPLEVPAAGVALEFTVWGAVVAGISAGLLMGLFNGLAVTRFALPPFVATLGTLSIARGLTYLWTGGASTTGLGTAFGWMGTGTWLRLPVPVWISVGVAMLFWLVSRRTRFGRYVYAIGGNERAAVLSGLRVQRVKAWVYVIAGGLAGLAGLLVTARADAADPNAGTGYELDSIAAVVIGGTSLSGGKGSVVGTILGCLIIGVLNNGLVMLQVSPFWQQVFKGVVILVAVAIDRAGGKQD